MKYRPGFLKKKEKEKHLFLFLFKLFNVLQKYPLG